MIKDHVFRNFSKGRDECAYMNCLRKESAHITKSGFRNRKARLRNGGE